MFMKDIILKKMNGLELSNEEINFFIQNYTRGLIPDYQASALLMAIYFQKMNKRETADLTMSMVNSGERLDLSEVGGILVDKHSTGGVGDKTTLVLLPMVSACGLSVPKMSGRGLGLTGGTIDKLESIDGLSTDMTDKKFIENVKKVGFAISSQTDNIVPADKKLYALRDVTGTVDNISLIASSVMSKKIACGADAIVLDVKTGNGAFMRCKDDAFELAREMVDIGNSLDKKTVAVVSDMDQPLGKSVGNALEVKEAIDTLEGNGPEDLLDLCLVLGSHMLLLAKKATDFKEAKGKLLQTIDSGQALCKFRQFVSAQGGDPKIIEDAGSLVRSKCIETIYSQSEGYIEKISALEIAKTCSILGCGRNTKDSRIDPYAGVVLNKKTGDRVLKGEKIATIYGSNADIVKQGIKKLKNSFSISKDKVPERQLIYGIVTEKGTEKYKNGLFPFIA